MTRPRRCAAILALLLSIAAPAAAAPGGERAAALDHLVRGAAAFRGGDMVAAMRDWSAAIRLANQTHAPEIAVEALARRGEMYRTQGFLRQARADLTSALAGAEAIGSDRLIAASSGALGSLALTERQVAAAEPLLLRSRALAERVGDRNTLAASSNDLGNLYAESGRPLEAEAAYTAAIEAAAAADNAALAAAAEVNAARLALQRKAAGTAMGLLQRAVARLERLPASYSQGMALLSAGSVILAGRGPPTAAQIRLAEEAFGGGAETARQLHDAAMLSLAQGNLGRLYARTGRAAAAVTVTNAALFAAQHGPAPELSYRWEWQKAQLAQRAGRVKAALADYRRAVDELESVRQDIPVEYRDGRSSYRVTFGPLYRQFADLLLRQASADPAAAAPLIGEARNTIERLKQSELQDYFRDSCIASFEARRRSIDTVAPGTAVLYPIALPDRLELLVSIGRDQRHFITPIREAALRAEAERFRELLEKRTTNEYLVPARQLYDQIIRPLEPLLAARHVDTIVVVPDDVLRIIPFAALYDGRHFLIHRFATAVVPSLHLVDPKPLSEVPQTALVLGVSKSVQGYVSLPSVSHEVAAVHRLAGGTELVDAAFTAASFADQLKTVPYNIVHIASHGKFSGDPKQTFVLAYDGKLDMNRLETDIKYGEHRENPLELLVLSACETASGDDRAALGLAGVALKAGARSALASLWYVNDDAAGRLIVAFYRALRLPHTSKAQALRAAQRELATSLSYGHPAYWAPFLLIGDWL